MSKTMDKLKKRYETLAITNDDFNMPTFIAQNLDKKKGYALMKLIGIETKYVRSKKLVSQGGEAFRTRFLLADGTSVGTFSGGADRFFRTLAAVCGIHSYGEFAHLDFKPESGEGAGYIDVAVSVVELSSTESTYNFELLDGNIGGMDEFVPLLESVFEQPPMMIETNTAQMLPSGEAQAE